MVEDRVNNVVLKNLLEMKVVYISGILEPKLHEGTLSVPPTPKGIPNQNCIRLTFKPSK